jgi:hypothetical protein
MTDEGRQIAKLEMIVREAAPARCTANHCGARRQAPPSGTTADSQTKQKAGIAAGLFQILKEPKSSGSLFAQAALASASEPSAALTISTTAVKEAASSMAIADRVLRSSSMPALCRPLMNIE